MTQYLCLPNQEIVSLDANGYFTAETCMSLADIVSMPLEAFLDALSLAVSGSELLTDLSYRIVGHQPNSLTLQVHACARELMSCHELEPQEEADTPLQRFSVNITRVGYGHHTVVVEAHSAQHAKELADEQAGDILYSEKCCEYLFDAMPVND